MTSEIQERTPLVVENAGLRIGDMNHVVDGHDNAALFSAYLDFLGELRSSNPSVASLRATDVEVLAQVTGLNENEVRFELHRCMTAQNPKKLTSKARAGVFAAFGVAILGGALALASVISGIAADAKNREVVARLEIGTALTIERAGQSAAASRSPLDIGSAVTFEN